MSEIIAIAADHAGIKLKNILRDDLIAHTLLVEDLGAHSADSVDYPDFANSLCKWLLAKSGRRGILICGSGIGMSIAANRHKGIRAALCRSVEEAVIARKHNNANVLCVGERITDEKLAKEILAAFLVTDFEGGRHEKRVEKLG